MDHSFSLIRFFSIAILVKYFWSLGSGKCSIIVANLICSFLFINWIISLKISKPFSSINLNLLLISIDFASSGLLSNILIAWLMRLGLFIWDFCFFNFLNALVWFAVFVASYFNSLPSGRPYSLDIFLITRSLYMPSLILLA